MAIERPIGEPSTEIDVESVEIETPEMDIDAVEMQEDGSAVINGVPDAEEILHDANLAEHVDENSLKIISSDLVGEYESDQSSRDEWFQAYRKGLELLGFKYEERTMPFAGSSGVTHPLLSESVTQFQAQAYKELLPSGGPVRTQILGTPDPQTEEQSERVKDYMNYQIMHVMEEFDPELDQMLFYLPLTGSTFKKIYFDATLGRAVSKFVASEDLIVPYTATDLQSAERVTHVLRRTENDIRKMQVAGMYRDVDVTPYKDETRIQETKNRIEGIQDTGYQEDYTLLEIHADLDVEGFEEEDGIKLPYIVTIDEGSGKVLAIYRNYEEEDPLKKKKQYFVHYKFLPGLGFYGFGLIHMLGGFSRTATSALRQLIDAGTLSNLPAGFKARGLRIKDDDTPLQPGEFRDVDAPSGDLRQGLLPLPYKEPSQTLFQLLGFVVQAGQRFATIADQKISDAGGAGAPVGTTMAIMERGTRVMSAIHKRMHYAQRIEFKLLAKLFKDYTEPFYPYSVGKDVVSSIKQADFDDRIDIIPVSDPNIFSMSQRVTLAQTQLQLAQADPGSHNMYEAYKRMYQALGVHDIQAILPTPKPAAPKDPGLENADALTAKKLTAFKGQDHQAHIAAHRTFMSTILIRNNPNVTTLLQAHIMEHISLLARGIIEQENAEEIQKIAQQYGGEIPPELQQQFQEQLEKQIAVKITEFIEEMFVEEQQSLEGQGEDPLVALKQQEINIRAQDLQRKIMDDESRIAVDQERIAADTQQHQDKIDSQEDIAQLRANVNLEKANTPRKEELQKKVDFEN
tara:strand:+ start:5266 stop:7659 length:2394 start_codon:yes stop_codon:yes gene_type:complete